MGNISSGDTILPEIFPTVTEEAAMEGDNVISTVDCPVHPGLF
jgi:hypothetical protein